MNDQEQCERAQDANNIKTTLREYGEEYPVYIQRNDAGRWTVAAFNEGGYNGTSVDLLDLITWLKVNKPELLV